MTLDNHFPKASVFYCLAAAVRKEMFLTPNRVCDSVRCRRNVLMYLDRPRNWITRGGQCVHCVVVVVARDPATRHCSPRQRYNQVARRIRHDGSLRY